MPAPSAEDPRHRAHTEAGPPAVALRSVSIGFGAAPDRHDVLSELSLAVPTGQFVSVIGASGCGKTTLLNLISGLLAPTTGNIEVFGEAPQVGRADVAYMFARDALLPWRTARHNVELGLELRGVRRAARHERSGELLDRLGLSHAAERYPAELSQGMRQRVALARTWASDPALLLMDEPFAALDAQTRTSVRDGFLSIWDDGVQRKTVAFVTHDITEALVLADRVILISNRGIGMDICVPYERPRDLRELMTRPDYRDVYDALEQALVPDR